MKKIINELLPPILKRMINARKWRFDGKYTSWQEALKQCDGYDSTQVVAGMKTRHDVWLKSYNEENTRTEELNSSQASKQASKQATYLDTNIRNILSYFLFPIIELKKDEINVLDIGGAAGSHFIIVRDNIPKSITLKWTINETESAAKELSNYFTLPHLTFNSDLNELRNKEYDIIYLSGTLQYLENPSKLFDVIKNIPHKYLIITRLPLINADTNILTVQRVPKSYYSGSYPVWFLSLKGFIKQITRDYTIIQEWTLENESVVFQRADVSYKGYLLKKDYP